MTFLAPPSLSQNLVQCRPPTSSFLPYHRPQTATLLTNGILSVQRGMPHHQTTKSDNTQPSQFRKILRENKEIKEHNIHPIKLNQEINTKTYFHPKSRCLEASVTVISICFHQNAAILAEQVLNIPTQMKHKKKSLTSSL